MDKKDIESRRYELRSLLFEFIKVSDDIKDKKERKVKYIRSLNIFTIIAKKKRSIGIFIQISMRLFR